MSPRNAKRGAVGQRVSRVDGLLKATGKATFTAEYKIDHIAHAVLVLARIARGTLARIDTSAARRAPGGQRRHHPGERPAHARGPVFGSPTGEPAAAASRIRHLGTNQIYYYGQPIAVVVAETLEEAEQAATLIAVGMRR
jgi:xanthine dehydrogenase YagR molybdenum-binding subunit